MAKTLPLHGGIGSIPGQGIKSLQEKSEDYY